MFGARFVADAAAAGGNDVSATIVQGGSFSLSSLRHVLGLGMNLPLFSTEDLYKFVAVTFLVLAIGLAGYQWNLRSKFHDEIAALRGEAETLRLQIEQLRAHPPSNAILREQMELELGSKGATLVGRATAQLHSVQYTHNDIWLLSALTGVCLGISWMGFRGWRDRQKLEDRLLQAEQERTRQKLELPTQDPGQQTKHK